MLDGSLRRERHHPQCRRVQRLSQTEGPAIRRTTAVRRRQPRAPGGLHTGDRRHCFGSPRNRARALRIISYGSLNVAKPSFWKQTDCLLMMLWTAPPPGTRVPWKWGLVLHRTRHLFVRQQTSVINAIRAHLAEFGIVAPIGRKGIEELLHVVADPADNRVPAIARACLAAFGTQLRRLKEQILEFDRMITAWHRSNEMSRRLDDCPGVGPALATASVATVADPKAFRSGRNFSAWIGLVPKQHSSGGKDRLGSICKQGDRYLRGLFVAGALAVIRYAKIHGTKYRPWLTALLARRPTKVAAIALANKLARMVWAMMAKGERYKEPVALAA